MFFYFILVFTFGNPKITQMIDKLHFTEIYHLRTVLYYRNCLKTVELRKLWITVVTAPFFVVKNNFIQNYANEKFRSSKAIGGY